MALGSGLSSRSTNHTKLAEVIKDCPFVCHDLAFTRQGADNLAKTLRQTGVLVESVVQQQVVDVLGHYARGLGAAVLGDDDPVFFQNTALNTMTGDSHFSDAWYVSTLGIGRGAIEVKKPRSFDDEAKKDLDEGSHLGQLYDYMQELRLTFNIEGVFGILTNYMFWRICWLNDAASKDRAAASGILPLPDGPREADTFPATAPVPTFSAKDEDAPSTDTPFTPLVIDSKLRASLCVGEIMRYDDPRLGKHLTSVLYKMSRATPTRAAGGKIALRVSVDTTDWHNITESKASKTKAAAASDGASTSTGGAAATVATSPLSRLVVDFNSMPAAQTKDFWLISRLGGGGDGTAWLATNSGRRVCVLKFFYGPLAPVASAAPVVYGPVESPAAIECKRWNVLWPSLGAPKARVETLLLGPALVLPFVKTRGDSAGAKAFSTDELAAVHRAIDHMASKGYQHNDIRWRHFGFFHVASGPSSKSLRAVLIDLSHVSEGVDPAQARDGMLKALAAL